MNFLFLGAVLLGLPLVGARAQGPATKLSDPTCQALQAAAGANDLPADFLTRLLWQESRFNALAISRAGAQGIAQFMPQTAAGIKLQNPFDAVAAIDKSAELLRNLKAEFGNLGIAAAAYNAGPKRVADWLAGRRDLPKETRDYVRIITGRSADDWIRSQMKPAAIDLPPPVPCSELARILRAQPIASSREARNMIAPARPVRAPWGIQLVGDQTQIAALAGFYRLQKKYPAVLGSRQPVVLRSPAGRNAYWYRVRVAVQTRNDADKLCSSLRAAGGGCLVQPN